MGEMRTLSSLGVYEELKRTPKVYEENQEGIRRQVTEKLKRGAS